MGLIPGLGRSPGEGNGNPLQYSCLGNPTDRGAWWAIVYGVTRVRHNLATKPPPIKLSTQFRVIQRMQREYLDFSKVIVNIFYFMNIRWNNEELVKEGRSILKK